MRNDAKSPLANLTYIGKHEEENNSWLFEQMTKFRQFPKQFNLRWQKIYDTLSDDVVCRPYIYFQTLEASTNSEGLIPFEIFRPYPCPDGNEQCFVGQAGEYIVYLYISDDNEIVHIEVYESRLDMLDGLSKGHETRCS